MSTHKTICGLFSLLLLLTPALIAAEESIPPPQGMGPRGQLQSLSLETGRTMQGAFILDGPDATQQLLVTGHFSSGQEHDLTREVAYESIPAGIVSITSTGLVQPLAEGSATITVKSKDGLNASVNVAVTRCREELPLNFERHVQPILTKFSCNSGACHGKAGGQNGFALSLLAFEMQDDYHRLASEGRGRRVFPAMPDRSLLLLKPIGKVPHGGGTRIPVDSAGYRILRRWITQGMPFGKKDDSQVVGIDVYPALRMMPHNVEQQLVVVARYADGTSEDVTGMAQYDSNTKELAQVNGTGLVTTLNYTGSASVMVRYQGHVATFRAPIPLGAPVLNLPKPRNFIDELVFRQLKSIGLPPSKVSSDEMFIRRVTLDIAGRLPTLEETEQFLASTDPEKRNQWIDTLLSKTEYADYFTRKWVMLLRSRVDQTSQVRGSIALQQWIREALYHNRPYSEFVTELLTASGDLEENPLVNWWRNIKEPSDQVENTAQIFLGLRLACARCHHHPFEKWSQQDYYGLAAFYSRVGRKYGKEYQANVERIFHDRGVASIPHPKTKVDVFPTPLGGEPLHIDPDDDPRAALAAWMTAPDNPYFSRALVNRYWRHFFGRGLIDPEDDMRETNPASNPELLDALARHFIEHGFDLKDLVRTICRSNVYQLSSAANDYNLKDTQHFARFYPRRMSAEVLLDSIDDVLMTKSFLGGAPALPPEARAVQLPHFPYPSQYFLTIFGTPDGLTSCECERNDTANLSQNLHLMNSSEVVGKVSSPTGRAAQLLRDKTRTTDQKIREVFLLAFSRTPTPAELELALKHLSQASNPVEEKAVIEDILWALINTKEFMYNH